MSRSNPKKPFSTAPAKSTPLAKGKQQIKPSTSLVKSTPPPFPTGKSGSVVGGRSYATYPSPAQILMQATFRNNLIKINEAYDREVLRAVLERPEADFGAAYDMTRVEVGQKAPDNFYFYKDNGSDILAVAHLDTVGDPWTRTANFVDTQDGEVVFSRALDDHLGAYVILELLPALGVKFDWLLTVGEESGSSTAAFFEAPEGKEYLWGIEFDRGGTDVVMYDYEDADTCRLVRESGARVGQGSFSDIAYLEHLEVKMFNWGVGYQDYHGPRAHAFLDDTFEMVAKFLQFHDDNADEYMPHEPSRFARRGRGYSFGGWSAGGWGEHDDYSDKEMEALWGPSDSTEPEVTELPDPDLFCSQPDYLVIDFKPSDTDECQVCGWSRHRHDEHTARAVSGGE